MKRADVIDVGDNPAPPLTPDPSPRRERGGCLHRPLGSEGLALRAGRAILRGKVARGGYGRRCGRKGLRGGA